MLLVASVPQEGCDGVNTKEKKARINEYCKNVWKNSTPECYGCTPCPLYCVEGSCKDSNDPETIEKCYEILFGFEPQSTKGNDTVNHPSHYNQGKYECIEVMVETFGKEATKNFCLLNAFKYIWRTGEKNGAEDVKKAIWYLDEFLELEGNA